mgnify:CR=1 FL=1
MSALSSSPPLRSAPGEKREARRAPIELKVAYDRLHAFFADYTKNISKGGTFIRTLKPLPIGTTFHFVLEVPDLEERLRLRGKVQWIVREEDLGPGGCLPPDTNAEPGMGIGFVYASEADRLRIETLVGALMRTRPDAAAARRRLG